ncbi:TPA: dTDP-6-deoxy-D-glucose-3,5-epimerase [Escherichia coli]
MITITKERLLTIKQWRETYGPDSNVVLPAEEAEELARIVLASLEAEPVLYQSCTRPTWNSGVPWTEWKERSRECYEDDLRFTDTPDHAGWINKCRKLYTTPPAPLLSDGLVKAVRFYEQVKRENPPVETGAWKDAVDWVLKEAFQAVSVLESSREHEVISQQEKA